MTTEQHPRAAEFSRQLVAKHAGRHAEQADGGRNHGGPDRGPRRPRRLLGRGKNQVCDDPGPQRKEFGVMNRIGKRIGDRLAIGEDRPKIEQGRMMRRRATGRGRNTTAATTSARNGPAADRPKAQCQFSTGSISPATRKRQAGPDAETGRVEGDAAALQAGRQTVGQRLQSRHVGAGQGDALQTAP